MAGICIIRMINIIMLELSARIKCRFFYDEKIAFLYDEKGFDNALDYGVVF